MYRSQAREQAFMLVFEKSFRDDISLEEMIEMATEENIMEHDEFTVLLAEKTLENLEDIDIYIEKYSKGWSKQRIPKVSLAILRLSLCEMLYFSEVPVSVSINEAVELTKKYGGENDSSFVNGILGSVSRDGCNE